VDKLDEPKGEPLLRGIAIHQEAEDYLNHKMARVPASLKKLRTEFRKLRDKDAVPEEQWGLTRDWEETGYFSNDVWLRMKIDSRDVINHKTLRLVDFKTGKIREGYEEQLELEAVAAFSIFDINTVRTELWYVDHGEVLGRDDSRFTFKLDDYGRLMKLWEGRIKAMLNDTRYTPTPNYTCQWCHFRKSNGGPCRY
jgi:hypothetical protein